jgi:hypothetical protein
MPTADVGRTPLEQTSHVSGRFGRMREIRWAGIGSPRSIPTAHLDVTGDVALARL